MKKIIIDYIERSILYRFFLGIYQGSFLVFMFVLLFFMSKVDINLIYVAIFFFASIIASLTYMEEYKYYTYRIELDGNFLKLKNTSMEKKERYRNRFNECHNLLYKIWHSKICKIYDIIL